jgi:2-polyprenyl-3-methyl-5-hydroxy-6-metoxy-1,4-benzoquinol methylase
MTELSDAPPAIDPAEHARIVQRIVGAYDARMVRVYCWLRFAIVYNTILRPLEQCLQGRKRVLELGCGLGLLGCYLAMRHPTVQYLGYDRDAGRIAAAQKAAARLGLANLTFKCADAASLDDNDLYDAIVAVDLLHHVNKSAQLKILSHCRSHVVPQGHLVIKEISLRPRLGLAITWLADVLVTRSNDMWYLSEADFRKALDDPSWTVEVHPIAPLLPFPHVVYLCHREPSHASLANARPA